MDYEIELVTVRCPYCPWTSEITAGSGGMPQQDEERRKKQSLATHLRRMHMDKTNEWRQPRCKT